MKYKAHAIPSARFSERTLFLTSCSSFDRYEMINVNLISKPKWFVEMNPSGKVPTILYNNEVYYESLAVCDLLDEVFKTSPKLNPESAEGKAKVKMALADFDTTIRHFYTIIRSTKPMEELQEIKEKFQTSLQSFEAKLNGKLYFSGTESPGTVFENHPKCLIFNFGIFHQFL